ncbi:MAG: hypothetical protein EVJ48_00050 [Candidatus Acidulodesulfobacterium acidiphilum]|uniref:DUF86 domain-containing protein n=1 Tax=Candidatus Acidulodesulfobacterium acidiphilum TaxID=2597224 RepID=A0A520XGQ1_9DELT|nr:MAG: hypothetical protein EVJ48_00050 [Candidatus Acidulodesulfobacterium acidiphilum]
MLEETLEIIDINIKRAESDYKEIKSWNALMPQFFDDDNKRRVIDSFIFRFIKIQDLMGEKLFKEVLASLGEYKRNMSFIDILDKMEKLEIIDSADKWNDYRELRNGLSHEYPLNEEEIVKDIKLATTVFEDICNVYLNIIKYLKNKKIIS